MQHVDGVELNGISFFWTEHQERWLAILGEKTFDSFYNNKKIEQNPFKAIVSSPQEAPWPRSLGQAELPPSQRGHSPVNSAPDQKVSHSHPQGAGWGRAY